MNHETLCMCGHCETRRWVERQDEPREKDETWFLPLIDELDEVPPDLSELREVAHTCIDQPILPCANPFCGHKPRRP